MAAELLAVSPETRAEALGHAAKALDLAEEEDEYLNALALKAGLEAEPGQVEEAKGTLRHLPPPEVSLGDPAPCWRWRSRSCSWWSATPRSARDRLRTLTEAQPDDGRCLAHAGLAAEVLDDDAWMRAAWKRRPGKHEIAAAGDDDARARARLEESEKLVIAVGGGAGRAAGEGAPLLATCQSSSRIFRPTPTSRLAWIRACRAVRGAVPERTNVGGQPGLTQIVLFRRNLERVAATEEELREEIRTTLLTRQGISPGWTRQSWKG